MATEPLDPSGAAKAGAAIADADTNAALQRRNLIVMWPPAASLSKLDPNSAVRGVWSMLSKTPGLDTIAAIGFGQKGDGPRYRAFISYSHRDEKIARWLHRKIETYAIPRDLVGSTTPNGTIPRRLSPIFRDEDELPGAAELGPELEGALRDSGALIVICSPASATSIWVDREIRLFKTLHPDRPVLAVIAAGVPGSVPDCFPEALRLVAAPDGGLLLDPDFEPLAPDLQKQDRQMVRLKLIAGLLGVKYNDLFRRDRRRARRFAALSGAAGLLIIALLSLLSIAAVTSARMAVHERNLARRAEALAEHNADMAERRAWLAQAAAVEVRRQSGLLDRRGACPPRTR